MTHSRPRPPLPDGLVVVVKQDCATCLAVIPVLAQLAGGPEPLAVYVQDDLGPFADLAPRDDTTLEISWHHDIETVPTLMRVEAGHERARTIGWSRTAWQDLTGRDDLGPELPQMRPGCGSLSVDPNLVDELNVRFRSSTLRARRVELAELEDEVEALFARGWTDGLPVVPPTEARVLRMLEGTSRAADEVVAIVPPNLIDVTVEKVAINAVMAGCQPEYLPWVLAAVDAVCNDEFNMHGVLATTMPVGPVVVANGPGATAIGMSSGGNVLGQGNRANLTIGRALQLVIRNVGGGRPGGVDRATHGNPGKLSFCFAEDEAGSPWTSLAESRGLPSGQDAVTVFAGEGPRCIVDQKARDPESLATTMAECLQAMHHPKLVFAFDAMLVVGPEHARVFAEAGWDRLRVVTEINQRTQRPGADLVEGAGGMTEGIPAAFEDATLSKLRDGGLLLVHAGGRAGLFSAIIGGWANGAIGSQPVTRPVPK